MFKDSRSATCEWRFFLLKKTAVSVPDSFPRPNHRTRLALMSEPKTAQESLMALDAPLPLAMVSLPAQAPTPAVADAAWTAFGKMALKAIAPMDLGTLLARAMSPRMANDEEWDATRVLCESRAREIMADFWTEPNGTKPGYDSSRFRVLSGSDTESGSVACRVIHMLTGPEHAQRREVIARRFSQTFGQERWALMSIGREDFKPYENIPAAIKELLLRERIERSRGEVSQERSAEFQQRQKDLNAQSERDEACRRIAKNASHFAADLFKSDFPKEGAPAALTAWARAGLRGAMDSRFTPMACLRDFMHSAEPTGVLETFDWRAELAAIQETEGPNSSWRKGQGFTGSDWALSDAVSAGPCSVEARLMFSSNPSPSEWISGIGKSAQAVKRAARLQAAGFPDAQTREKIMSMKSASPQLRTYFESLALQDAIKEASENREQDEGLEGMARKSMRL